MRFTINIQATHDDGVPVWGYFHEEVFVGQVDAEGREDAQANALRLAASITERVDEGRAAIVQQAGVDLPALAEQQERAEADHRRRRRGPVGRS